MPYHTAANEGALLALEFANGAHGVIQVSGLAHIGDRGQEQHVVLHGAAGTLEAKLVQGGEVSLAGARAEKPATPPTDAEIAAIVVAANQVDIDAGKLASGKAQSADVRTLAQRMVTDHTGVNQP